MIGRLRQLSEPRLRQQAGTEKSLTSVERDILVQWVRKGFIGTDNIFCISISSMAKQHICMYHNKKLLNLVECEERDFKVKQILNETSKTVHPGCVRDAV